MNTATTAGQVRAGDALVSYHEAFAGVVTRADAPAVASVETYGAYHVKLRLTSGEVVVLDAAAAVTVTR